MAKFADFPQIMFGSSQQFACLGTCFYQITPANSPVMFGRFFAISSEVSCLKPHVGPVTNYHLTQFSELSHFQEKVIPEEDEEEAEEIRVTREAGNTNGGPYDSAIQGYKSFAKSALNNGSSSDSNPVTSERSSPASSLSHSASTSSMSPAPSSSSTSRPPVEKSDTTVEAWEEKIETFVQPARRVSAEISNKMKEKLANFEESKTDKEQTPVRLIEPDNSFRDKLKAFKTIESVASESREAPSGTLGTKPTRRESEPSLGLANAKPKGMPSYRSTSSSFMNTFQNNKFFQQVTNS